MFCCPGSDELLADDCLQVKERTIANVGVSTYTVFKTAYGVIVCTMNADDVHML